jgi:hypothetical protein
VNAQTGHRAGVIGNLGAPCHIHRRVGFARRHYLESASSEERAEPHAHLQREVLFRLATEACACVVAAMRGIEDHNKARHACRILRRS